MAKKRYSIIKKMQTVWLLRDSTLTQVSEISGVPTSTIRKWEKNYEQIKGDYYKYLHDEGVYKVMIAQNRMADKIGDLTNAITDKKIEAAPLNQLSSALGVLVDRFLRIHDAKEIEEEASDNRFQIEYYDADTGKITETPPWTDNDAMDDAALHDSFLWQTLWENRIGEASRNGNGGEGHEDLVARPTYQMASQVWRDLKATMTHATGIQIRESEKRIELPTGGVIEIRSTHYPDNLRGAGLDYAVLDEAAYMHPDVWAEVVRPMLLESQGGALFLSTPRGKNWFWHLYNLGLDPLEDKWRSFHFESWVNPLVAKAEIDDIRRTTSERTFREEYEAEFLEDSGAVFRGLSEAAVAPTNAQYIVGHRYIMGVDWGKDHDYTVLVVMDSTTRQMVAIDRFNQIDYRFQRQRLKVLADKWHPSVIWAEANSIGTPIIEQLRDDGLPVRPFMTTSKSKAPLIEALSLAIERGELALLPNETLLAEMASYQIDRSSGGNYRYNAPAGMHDDTVIATALAWHGCQSGGLRVDFA